MSKKATIEDLIARKLQSDDDKLKVKLIDIGNDLALEIRKQRLSKVLSLLDGIDEKSNLSESVDFMVQLVYDSCPMLHDKALRSAYECVEPYDIVLAVLDDNIGLLSDLADAVMDFYGISMDKKDDKGSDLADDVKN